MTELKIIKTENSQALERFLEQKHINYEVYQEKSKKISEGELGQAYREAWSNPQRYQKAQKWEKAAVSDWAERSKKERNKDLHKK